eukprot:7168526-Pyramimonas_sp.AAC.1
MWLRIGRLLGGRPPGVNGGPQSMVGQSRSPREFLSQPTGKRAQCCTAPWPKTYPSAQGAVVGTPP